MIIDIMSLVTGVIIGIIVAVIMGFPILIYIIRKRLKKVDAMAETKPFAEAGEVSQGPQLISIFLDHMEKRFEILEKKIDFIYEFLKTRGTIRELGDFTGTYAQFMEHVEEEIKILESGNIHGPEAFRRQRLLEFSLSMALVYARVRGDIEMVPKIEKWLTNAKKLH